ncbi:MAG: ion transporter [Candidatus Omnitrophica bacterium]|nr:ion transporter [Candidatus Omnitrophota bacterium]
MKNNEQHIQGHPDPLRRRMFAIIFEAENREGRLFDIILLWTIIVSVLAVVLESVESIRSNHGGLLIFLEWVFTVLFTVEYGLRLYCVRRPIVYARSFLGIIDLLAILPTYLGTFIFPGASSLLVIRALRLLRVFRVLKLAHLLDEYTILIKSLRASLHKMAVFLMCILTLVVISGTVMYLIEGGDNGFTSIPRSVYWAIVTMTTVGYGDIAPQTVLGQFMASLIMMTGYTIIVVPTGIFSVELHRTIHRRETSRVCPACTKEGHAVDSLFCRFCGEALGQPQDPA